MCLRWLRQAQSSQTSIQWLGHISHREPGCQEHVLPSLHLRGILLRPKKSLGGFSSTWEIPMASSHECQGIVRADGFQALLWALYTNNLTVDRGGHLPIFMEVETEARLSNCCLQSGRVCWFRWASWQFWNVGKLDAMLSCWAGSLGRSALPTGQWEVVSWNNPTPHTDIGQWGHLRMELGWGGPLLLVTPSWPWNSTHSRGIGNALRLCQVLCQVPSCARFTYYQVL